MPGYIVNNNTLEQAPAVVVQQPTVVMAPQMVVAQQRPRKWTSGLCGCLNDVNICLAVMFCPFCYEIHLATKANESCCIPFIPGAILALRTKIRALNYIRGSILDDCFKLTVCFPCALCQMAREIDIMQV